MAHFRSAALSRHLSALASYFSRILPPLTLRNFADDVAEWYWNFFGWLKLLFEVKKHGILVSMSGKGNCYDNAMVETFFKTLKSELVWRTVFYTPKLPTRPLAATSMGFTIPSGAIPLSTSPARLSSKNMPPNEPMPLH